MSHYKQGMADNERLKEDKDCLDVWPDIAAYAKAGFAAIAPEDFTRMRWFGIYQQKPNEGHFMFRIKLPGGRLTPAQLREIGALTRQYARGFSDITTRQDIQLHWLTIADFPDVFDRIYNKAGLYTDFACGDTPRNVCSCPLSDLIPNQVCQVGDIVQKVSDMYRAGGKEFSNLPRKFKTSISACPLHCHQPQINDIGAFGVIRQKDGREERGLGLVVGGGLSSTPHFAQGLRVFIPEAKIHEQLPAIMRHITLIFNDSDECRYKRKHARFKFVVAAKGWQWVRDELEKRLGYALDHDDSIVDPRGALHTDHMGVGKQSNGLFYVGSPVERGRWSAEQMIAVADLAERFGAPGQAQIRLSQKQNLLLVNIPEQNVAELSKELGAIGLSPKAPLWRANLVSCTGMQFCNLAVTETKDRAQEILQHLEKEVPELDSPIMVSVSGCPNSCAQVHIADVGLTGTKAIYNGEKVDAFDLMLGGCLGSEKAWAQTIVPKIPAMLVKTVVAQLTRNYLEYRTEYEDGEVEPFRAFVARHDTRQLAAYSAIEGWTPPAKRILPAEAKPAPEEVEA
jgi:sulfite reductase beta subunit-like hemoprotein